MAHNHRATGANPVPGTIMLFPIFHHKLKQLNRRLHVDCDREIKPYHKNFPIAGLYLDGKYLFGVSHQNVYEHTIIALNAKKLAYHGYFCSATGDSGNIINADWVENIRSHEVGAIDERILSRGYMAIVSQLVQSKHVSKKRAEDIFGFEVFEHQHDFPKRYLDLCFKDWKGS